MLIFSFKFAVRLESPGPNSQLSLAPNVFKITPWHGPRSENMSRGRYPASPLARYLHLQKTICDRYALFCDLTAYTELCLPSRCLETGCITQLFYCWVDVLLSNGCFCGSAVLTWNKYATICIIGSSYEQDQNGIVTAAMRCPCDSVGIAVSTKPK
jgi:hypothetical protein